jgi:hypothetical protein
MREQSRFAQPAAHADLDPIPGRSILPTRLDGHCYSRQEFNIENFQPTAFRLGHPWTFF